MALDISAWAPTHIADHLSACLDHSCTATTLASRFSTTLQLVLPAHAKPARGAALTIQVTNAAGVAVLKATKTVHLTKIAISGCGGGGTTQQWSADIYLQKSGILTTNG